MERLTKPLCGGYELPMIPMEIKTQYDLQKFHEARRFYESCAIRCGQYEDTGLEPEEVTQIAKAAEHMMFASVSDFVRYAVANFDELQAYKALGPIDHLRELFKAESEGRLVVLPCKDTIVYTVEEDYFNCNACEHKDKSYYQPSIQRISCDMDDSENCPMYIKEHTVEGFTISFKDGNVILSAPGEWGYEGLEPFFGIDGKWYLTREEAEAALAADTNVGNKETK